MHSGKEEVGNAKTRKHRSPTDQPRRCRYLGDMCNEERSTHGCRSARSISRSEFIMIASFAQLYTKLTEGKYATKLYGDQAANGMAEEEDSDAGGDIEAEINKELADIRKPTMQPLFQSVKLDTQCCKQILPLQC